MEVSAVSICILICHFIYFIQALEPLHGRSGSDKEESEVGFLPPTVEEFNRAVALRHHIAHFCPTQDIARKCIRHCMEFGKPSFCGKDHNCYCGHRYNSHDINHEIDVNATNNQFRDLYEKYFGPEADLTGMKN